MTMTPQKRGQEHAWQRPATLYRLFDQDGTLLYVGATLNVFSRLAAHRSRQPWFFEVARVELEHFEERADALRAEARAIEEEEPKHNVTVPSARLVASFDFEAELARKYNPIEEAAA